MSEVTRVCKRCDSEMKLIPAGFSRTKNKPYNAFWTCDKRNGGCGATESASPSEGANASANGADAGLMARVATLETKVEFLMAKLSQ